MAPPRHLALLPDVGAVRREWPAPFAAGLAELLELRGRRVVVLASGDPFWFGVGGVISRHLAPDEWRAIPGVSTFSLAAARLGWRVEDTVCLGLHGAPFTRLRPYLAPGLRSIVLLRDGAAVSDLAAYLCDVGFGRSQLTVMEALGGPRERIFPARADTIPADGFAHPVCAALTVAGEGVAVPSCSGIDDAFFDHDGQMTKRPMRALTLSALAPAPFESLWDIGGGSGSVAVEWLLTHPTATAISIEAREDRAARIRVNADRLGVDRLRIVSGTAPVALDGLPTPNAVFVGGGLSEELLLRLDRGDLKGVRLVANAVTLESEVLLAQWHGRRGGTLMRIGLASARPLGSKRGWNAAYPVVQWSVTL